MNSSYEGVFNEYSSNFNIYGKGVRWIDRVYSFDVKELIVRFYGLIYIYISFRGKM